MLTELHVENLGVIESLDLVFGPGLTALTGETGAGKTMLVDAIELLVGGRADAAVVRHGAAEARVDGRFVEADDRETVLSRVVPADGRSRAYVDGRLATVATLAEAASGLVDLHGQHAHQRLLSGTAQRAALDAFGRIDLSELRAARARLTALDAELAALGGDARARAREIDLLRYQVTELDAAALADPAEDDALDVEESTLADAEAHREAAARSLAALTDEAGARDTLAAALADIERRAPFTDLAERLRALLAELDDLAPDLRTTADAIEESPDRLAEIRERRQLLVDLRRKYGEDLAAVMAFHAAAEDRLRELEGVDARAAELDRARAAALADERAAAHTVGSARRASAPELAATVEQRLRTLAMPAVSIAVEVGDHADDDPGDRVRILFAANPGSPLLPLNRVASGGELARTMLALRLALLASGGDDRAHDSLVFDEVDAGIGGLAAQAVAEALATLGRTHQVFVVTHLAQVAALADAQIRVDKAVRGGQTFTTATVLDDEQRVEEVARMLSGSDSTSAREHARELLS
jgi:DNA repair protein RecN (Recombination protein N)